MFGRVTCLNYSITHQSSDLAHEDTMYFSDMTHLTHRLYVTADGINKQSEGNAKSVL